MRYFLFDEFFGLRVYDSYEKTEFYFDKNNSENSAGSAGTEGIGVIFGKICKGIKSA